LKSGSQQVLTSLNMFSKMFPIASHFYPICFAHNYPLFTYICGLKWKVSKYRNFYYGSF
jgi:hypothetical protein